MLLVQLGINSTRDVWKFAKLDSPRRLVQFWQNFQTSRVLLIPNCTRHRMITYTYTPVVFVIFNKGMRKMAQLLQYYFVTCRMRMKETSLSGRITWVMNHFPMLVESFRGMR